MGAWANWWTGGFPDKKETWTQEQSKEDINWSITTLILKWFIDHRKPVDLIGFDWIYAVSDKYIEVAIELDKALYERKMEKKGSYSKNSQPKANSA